MYYSVLCIEIHGVANLGRQAVSAEAQSPTVYNYLYLQQNSVNGGRGQARRQAMSPCRPARSVQALGQSSVLPIPTAEELIGLFPGTSYAFDGSRYRSSRSTDWHLSGGADGKEEA